MYPISIPPASLKAPIASVFISKKKKNTSPRLIMVALIFKGEGALRKIHFEKFATILMKVTEPRYHDSSDVNP